MKLQNRCSFFKGILFLVLLMLGSECYAQFNRGMQRGMGRGMGRQRSAIPQAQHTPEPPAPKTSGEIVEDQMPAITEALALNDFEAAVVSSILKKYVQERIEAQILKLPPEKMKETFTNISERQDEELKMSLPPEKYEAFLGLMQDGVNKTIKKNKKKKKKQKKEKN
ncbi:hypothetical protein ACFQZJ_18350 [Maribacter chungangensis]|uniref:Uncharacterized protein n=1 Tax=Maribacter chungangensis TaxID=1069117 RepID=A0ABW3B8F6_9FLAO